jgi:hypothetical protein
MAEILFPFAMFFSRETFAPEGVTSKLKPWSNKLSTPLTYTKLSAY